MSLCPDRRIFPVTYCIRVAQPAWRLRDDYTTKWHRFYWFAGPASPLLVLRGRNENIYLSSMYFGVVSDILNIGHVMLLHVSLTIMIVQSIKKRKSCKTAIFFSIYWERPMSTSGLLKADGWMEVKYRNKNRNTMNIIIIIIF